MGHVFNISRYKQGSVHCAARHVPGVVIVFHQSSLKLSRLSFEVCPLRAGTLKVWDSFQVHGRYLPNVSKEWISVAHSRALLCTARTCLWGKGTRFCSPAAAF